jgi:hypothetical protein
METNAKVLVCIIFGLFVVFLVLLWIYLKRNNFAAETLESIFPVLGAILLSLYLCAKSVWIDSPKPQSITTTAALLSENGTVRGLNLSNFEQHLTPFVTRGMADIDKTLTHYDALSGIPAVQILRRLKGPDPSHTAMDLVELCFVRWVCHPRLAPGAYDEGPGLLVTAHLTHERNPHQDKLCATIIDLRKASNDLLKADERNLSINLPPRSQARVVRTGYGDSTITIKTAHSEVSFIITPTVIEGLSKLSSFPNKPHIKRIYDGLQISTSNQSLALLTYRIQGSFTIFPLTRFSQQAKLEAKWHENLKTSLERDFSWVLLRTALVTDK